MTKLVIESNVGGTGTLTIYAPSTSNVATIDLPTATGTLLTTGSTGLNASNITEGTLANARTTASSSNGANTIVLRDASGNFSANIITADGSALTAINASNISSGTIANARTTAASANGASTIVARDASGAFAAGTITATFSGDGSGVTGINGSNVSSGTVANARTTASSSNGASTIVSRGASGEFSAGTITATFSGSGASVTSINAANISSGILAVARGGTNNAFFAVSGPATSEKTYTFPNENMSVGYRNLPAVGTKTGSYTLQTADVGKYVQVGSGGSITIPDATFAEGDAISIFNNTTGAITITCTITTAYIAGTDSDKASVSLATRGVATILFISSTVCVISGNVT